MSSLEESVVRRPIGAAARELGAELRQERLRAEMGTTTVASSLGWSKAKLSKLERGWRGTDEWDVGTLLGAYGTDKSIRERLRKLAQRQDEDWLVRDHVGRRPEELLCWRVHEDLALKIACYEPLAIPSLLQTENYALGLSGGVAEVGDRIEPAVEQRFGSRQVLDGSVVPEVAVFIHEIALRLVVGNETVMHDQLMHLNFQGDRENLRLRIVPSSAGARCALRRPGVLMTFVEPLKPLACLETESAVVFTEQEQAVAAVREKFDLLGEVALGEDASRDVLRYWVDVYDNASR